MTVRCYCGLPANVACSWTDSNPGRRFYCCVAGPGGCGFFAWLDPPMCQRAVVVIPGLLRSKNQVEGRLKSKERQVCRLKVALYGSWVLFAWAIWVYCVKGKDVKNV